MSYTALIEELQALPTEDKIEVRSLIDKYIIEDKRNQIEKNYKASLKRAKAGKLHFTTDIDELMNSVK
jgi:hypothetical protein